jgi:dihydrofolate reductase/thymidylate synthase
MYKAIYAVDEKNGIGKNNQIPWFIRDDFIHFKKTTTSHVVIMGRKTFQSLKKPLNNRINIILSRSKCTEIKTMFPDVLIFDDIEKLIEYNKTNFKFMDYYVIGGAEILKLFEPYIIKHIITFVRGKYDCDTFYTPPISYHFDSKKEYEIINHSFQNDTIYRELYSKIIRGRYIKPEFDRTGLGYYVSIGEKIQFDVSDNTIPISTDRKIYWKGIVEELLWFLRGDTDNKLLNQKNIHIWDGNSSSSFIENLGLDYKEGICGPIYGSQWRHWNGDYDSKTGKSTGGIDQFKNIIDKLSNEKTRYDRRLIMSGWNVADLDKMVLPPCHMIYQFQYDGLLHLTFTQRSSDVLLACSWNVSSASLLLHIVCKLCNLKPGTVTMFITNAHIYTNHVIYIDVLINRELRPFPKLILPDIIKFDELDKLNSNNILLYNYKPHEAIPLIMNI